VKLRRIVAASVGVGLSVLLAAWGWAPTEAQILADSEITYARQAHPPGWLEDHGAEVDSEAANWPRGAGA
jgi:hypothetical protein